MASYQDIPNPIIFPVASAGFPTYADGWDDLRDGGTRRHRATDIYGTYGTKIFASTSGVVDSWMPGTSHPITVGSGGGYQMRIDNGAGERYVYAHFGPDELGKASEAFAPGIEPGVSVQAGQHIGWLGESGATASGPHLHMEIRDLAGVVTDDPYADYQAVLGTEDAPRYNPYPSLQVASPAPGPVVSELFLGNAQVQKLYLGATQLSRLYLGTTLVFDSGAGASAGTVTETVQETV